MAFPVRYVIAYSQFNSFIASLRGNGKRESRAELEAMLPKVHAQTVDVSDIPLGYRQATAPFPPDAVIVRYTRYGVSMHIVYGADGRLIQIIPTYE